MKVGQVRKNYFLDYLSSPTFIRERVIIAYTRKNPFSITVAKLAFKSATKSNTNYLMVENKQLENNLQVFEKEVKHLYAVVQSKSFARVHLEEMKQTILEVSTLGETM